MTIANWIQLCALLVTISTLIWQQHLNRLERTRKEQRTEIKLRIFYAISLAERDLDEAEILNVVEKGQPLKKTDSVEVRKALYEMLSEETLRFTKARKYKVRDRSSNQD